jgi:hypothetical protein
MPYWGLNLYEKPEASMKVTTIELTPEQKKKLTLPPGAFEWFCTPPHKRTLRMKARRWWYRLTQWMKPYGEK